MLYHVLESSLANLNISFIGKQNWEIFFGKKNENETSFCINFIYLMYISTVKNKAQVFKMQQNCL